MGSQTENAQGRLAFFTIGATLFDDPAVWEVGADGMSLWLYLNSRACGTGGWVSRGTMSQFISFLGGPAQTVRAWNLLLEHGLLEPDEQDEKRYRIRGWRKYQYDGKRKPSDYPEQTRERKRKSRERARAGASPDMSRPTKRDSVTPEEKRGDYVSFSDVTSAPLGGAAARQLREAVKLVGGRWEVVEGGD